LQVRFTERGPASVREVGTRIARELEARAFPASQPLVFLVDENLAKALGQYISQCGALPLKFAVLDEIKIPDAQYAHVGRLHNHVIPVSFHGFQP
jgi:ethanolamine utilization protein EutA (predicted chaperonin)